jgi:hypothetical protein
MEALFAEFLKSLLPEAVAAAGAEAAASPIGQAVGDIATQSVGQQIQPAMNLYDKVTAPDATAGDMARSAFEYTIQSEKDPQNKVTIPAMSPMNPYANMSNNTVGGIPSLLQNTQSGLLPFFSAR